ncbi:MAG: sucrase ferredoxin [Gaiellales bacterium]
MAVKRCSSLSLSLGEPLVATASAATAWLLVEQSGPWGARALSESALDREVGAELERRAKRLGIKILLVKQQGKTGSARRFAAWSEPGSTWLEELELDGPDGLLDLDLEALARGERLGGRRIATPVYLACTNGKRDACCASRGRAVTAALAALRPEATFECSHLGGHRFAANVVCLPHGLWYGRVEPEDAEQIVAAAGRGELVLHLLRGRSSLPSEAQAADRFLREREGLRGIEELAVETVESAGGGVTAVSLRAEGRMWRVLVRADEADEPRPVSCGEEKLERPTVWTLVGIERAG